MKILTLKNNQANHIKIITYPDGQRNIEIDLDYYAVKYPIEIHCRIRKFDELEVLLCIVAALRKNDRIILNIQFEYIFGMRSDRAFAIGQPNYFRDVIIPILNNLKCTLIFRVPHNKYLINDIQRCHLRCHIEGPAFNPSSQLINGEIFKILGGDESSAYIQHFNKVRKESEINVSLTPDVIRNVKNYGENVLIVDDLLDGGETFIAEANYLRNIIPDKKIFLSVEHAIFSKGIEHVTKHFDHVYCTNSYQDFPDNIPSNLTIIEVI